MKLITSAVVAFATLSGGTVFAQDFPGNTIVFTVPFPAGGGADIPARQLVDKIGKQTGWNIVVENHPGAGGNIGLAQVSRTAPDGLNIGIGQTGSLAINPSLYADIPYNSLEDFTHISLVTSQPMAIITFPDSDFADFGDVIEAAQANPGSVLYGTPGAGTVSHLAIELLESEAGLEFSHVPYTGIANAIADVMGGVVDVYVGSVPSVLPHVRAGSVRVLAVTSAERNPAMPDTPTVAEFGFEGFAAADWRGIVGPAGIPDDILRQLNAAINDALNDEELRALFESDGSTVLGGTPEEFSSLLASQLDIWAVAVEESGATVQ